MRKMIPQGLIDFIKNLKDKILHNDKTNTTEFGGNVEVDGNLKVNGDIDTEFKVIKIHTLLNITRLEKSIKLSDNTSLEHKTHYNPEQMLNILNKYKYVAYGCQILRPLKYEPENIAAYDTIDEFSYNSSYFVLECRLNESDWSTPYLAIKLSFYSDDRETNYILIEEI